MKKFLIFVAVTLVVLVSAIKYQDALNHKFTVAKYLSFGNSIVTSLIIYASMLANIMTVIAKDLH